MNRIIKSFKGKIDLKKENQVLRDEIKELINKIDEKDNRINELEFELLQDIQAQKIENQAYLITKLREDKKLNANEVQKERRKRIEVQEEKRNLEYKIKMLEQDLRVARKTGF